MSRVSKAGKKKQAIGGARADVQEATRSFERWMRSCAPVVESDLRLKHEQMRESPFLFLRGSFYRWAQVWPQVCGDLARAPKVLAVGDLHVDSFGTWRDAEGRLCWGVDDFDESYPMAYTNDLVRLATSVRIVIDAEGLTIGFKDGCDAILEGYAKTLKKGGCPFVMEEHEQKLGKLGVESFKPPKDFWEKLNHLPAIRGRVGSDLKRALEKTLPEARLEYKVVRRQAGLGSLGQERFVAITQWKGGLIAREAKQTVPSSCVWVEGKSGHGESFYQQAISSAVRSRDPFQVMEGQWLIRRLSPDSNPIEIETLPKNRDEEMLLRAMGAEAANVHLGSRRQTRNILKDLQKKKASWVRDAATVMAKAVEKDWNRYRRN